jgi:hypothetical protein
MQINSEHKYYCNKTIAIFYLLTDSLLVRVNSIFCNITGKYVTEKHVGIQYIITCYVCRNIIFEHLIHSILTATVFYGIKIKSPTCFAFGEI